MPSLTVVFDLDGTLVDTAPDLVAATNHVMGRARLPAVDADHLRPCIGLGARRMIAEAASRAGHALGPPDLDRMLDEFLSFYAEHIAVTSAPFPGAVAALDDLAGRGARLAICTNKRFELAQRLLTELGLATRFCLIAGRDTFDVHKPHPGHLLATIAGAGGDPGHSVMVGDSSVDIETAKAAGVPVVAVSFGYADQAIAGLGPDAVIDHFDELMPALSALNGRAFATS
jgi:phosphoglycolate phosphatase